MVLRVLGIASVPLINQIFTKQQLIRNVLLNGIPFILIFAAIVLFFVAFVWAFANGDNPIIKLGKDQINHQDYQE